MEAPGVPVYPVYGMNVSTPLKFKYKKESNWDEEPEVVWDGTVNRQSLEYGNVWKDE